MEMVDPGEIDKGRIVLPPLPKVNKPKIEKLKTSNKSVIKDQPWTLGLVEAVGAVDIIERQKFETKNRIALIILDSNFEIALKEFIVHRHDLFPPSNFGDAALQKLFKNRNDVINLIEKHTTIPPSLISKSKHYYAMRNKLIHERATLQVTDSDIENYRETTQKVMKILFGLKFS
jgi:hypothetical protein